MFNRYYEDELNKLKNLAVEFAQSNPALAPMLLGTSADPDVERLLEGVAFLTGLTRQKLDDEFPEFVQEIANLLFPHYLRPLPASTLMHFRPKNAPMEVVHVAAGAELDSVPVDGTPCRFRTCYDLEVQPLAIVEVNLVSEAGIAPVLNIDFELQSLNLAQWQSDSIRLFLSDAYVEASKLFLLLNNHVRNVSISSAQGQSFSLRDGLRASGFDQPLLSYPSHAFSGFRNVQEFFVLPEKFLFMDILQLRTWVTRGKGERFRVCITFDQLPEWAPVIRRDSFMLHVMPAINLFPHAADPISHEHLVSEYRITPEGKNRQHYQVYTIDQVLGYQQGLARERRYLPFSMLEHDGKGMKHSYRIMSRAATAGRGKEIFLSINYPPGETPVPETLSIQITCSNRSLPESLKLGDVCQPTGTSPDRMYFQNIVPVTPALDPPDGESLLWRLISHMSLNFLSLANTKNLQAMLSLYIFPGKQEMANRRRIDGIQQVTSTQETRLIGRGGILRGQLIRIECQQEYFAGIGDMYVFGCMLERFLGDYAGINSYTRVELVDAFSGAVFQWPPRLGQQPLL